MAKTEAQLIEETREAGRAFLRRKPSAFGGGIDPETGIRRVAGRRVSVAGAGEVAGVGGVPTLEQARAITERTAIERQLTATQERARIEIQKAKATLEIVIKTKKAKIMQEAARKQLRQTKERARTRLAAALAKKLKIEEKFIRIFKRKPVPIKKDIIISKEREALSFQSKGELVFRNPEAFAKSVNRKTGSTSFTSAVPIRRQDGKLFVQDFNFRFDKQGNLISARNTGSALLDERHFLQRDRSRSNRLLREAKEERAKGKAPSLVPLSVIPIPSITQAKAGFVRAIDFVSGGVLTERNLNKRGEQINRDIEKFNKDFGGKELSEAQFNRANTISKSIEKRERTLTEERDKLARSTKSRIAGFISPLKKRRTQKQIKKDIQRNQSLIRKKEKTLKKINADIEKAKKKPGKLSKINLRRLGAAKSGFKGEIQRLKEGRHPEVIAGEFPIIPAVGIPSGVTAIKFLGTQKKGKGGKVITDIVFKTSKGRVGVARGVSVTKGKKTASVVLGRSGKVAFKFPTATKKLTSVRSFVGREVSLAKPGRFAIKTQIAIKAKVGALKTSRKIGKVTKIKKNIQAFKQAGIGQVLSVKGKKFIRPFVKFPSGKIITKRVKGVGLGVEDFASISAIFTKKELSLIIGKSITRAGSKAKFIGLIKGTSKAGKVFSIGEKQQFAKALGRVISTTSAALAQSKKISGLTKVGSLATASRIAVDIAKGKPTKIKKVTVTRLKPRPKPIPPRPKPIPPKTISGAVTKQVRKTRVARKTKTKPVTKATVTTKPKITQKATQRLKSLQKQKQRLAQKTSQTLTQKQITRQRQRLRQVQKQINKLTLKFKIPFAPGIKGVLRIPIIPKIKRKARKRKARRKAARKQAYNVLARPLKKTKKSKRRKLIKVNKVPLRKRKAKDLRNYILDTSLSRTGKIKKAKGSPRKPKLRFPRGYAKKTTKKFRRHRIVKGKRKLLPKGKVIEKRRHLLDTIQEKRKIGLRRRIKQITRKPKRVIRRSPITGVRRKQMLTNLAKARKVRASNLKRRPIRTITRSPRTRTRVRIPVRRRPGVTGASRQQMLTNLEKARRVRASNLRRGKR